MRRRKKLDEYDQRWVGDDRDDSCPDDLEMIKAGIPGKTTPPASEWAGIEKPGKVQRRKR